MPLSLTHSLRSLVIFPLIFLIIVDDHTICAMYTRHIHTVEGRKDDDDGDDDDFFVTNVQKYIIIFFVLYTTDDDMTLPRRCSPPPPSTGGYSLSLCACVCVKTVCAYVCMRLYWCIAPFLYVQCFLLLYSVFFVFKRYQNKRLESDSGVFLRPMLYFVDTVVGDVGDSVARAAGTA